MATSEGPSQTAIGKEREITRQPRLSIGLPVYNGEKYLAQSLDALLGQTFEDFELIICSNASTDGTDDVCREYAGQDSRIRFLRQPRNVGASPNHHAVFLESRGKLFKWASADDLYARDLLQRCVEVLDEHPEVVLAHSWTAAIDGEGNVLQAEKYPLATDSPRAPDRLLSILYGGDDLPGAIRSDDFYGVIRSDVLRRVRPLNSYYHADYTFTAEIALNGPFSQFPDWLYFRRHHPGRALQANPTVRSWCANLDPRRADKFRHPTARLVGEFAFDYVAAVGRAPLSAADRRECYRHLARWGASRVQRRFGGASARGATRPFAGVAETVSPLRSVAGQGRGT